MNDNVTTFLLENWVLVLMALTSGTLLLWPSLARQGGGAVGAAEAVRLINREKAVLIDVSEPDEFAQGHAAGARKRAARIAAGLQGTAVEQGAAAVLMVSDRRACRARGQANCASSATSGDRRWRWQKDLPRRPFR